MTTTPQKLEQAFWKSLKSDMTAMLGLDGTADGHTRPMTAQVEEERGPAWFFPSVDNPIAQQLVGGTGERATFAFSAKDHDLFASMQGSLRAHAAQGLACGASLSVSGVPTLPA